MYRRYPRRRTIVPTCPTHGRIQFSYGQCMDCAKEAVARRIAEIKALPDHITYTNWAGEEKVWSPSQSGVYFYLIVDKAPTKPVPEGANYDAHEISLEWGSVGCYTTSHEKTKAQYLEALRKFPGFDWSKTNARIVKAPCAFDAHKHGVVVENLIQGEQQ